MAWLSFYKVVTLGVSSTVRGSHEPQTDTIVPGITAAQVRRVISRAHRNWWLPVLPTTAMISSGWTAAMAFRHTSSGVPAIARFTGFAETQGHTSHSLLTLRGLPAAANSPDLGLPLRHYLSMSWVLSCRDYNRRDYNREWPLLNIKRLYKSESKLKNFP